jgi:type II secretory pathway predicted ATPase ExeA
MNTTWFARYGLKWNPFSPEVPTSALHVTPAIENFCWRIEHTQVREGGFALITGSPGTGKSVTLRLLAERLAAIPELSVGAMTHPQSSINDFYRELGDVFGVSLRPHNRWGGFKALRERWLAHLGASLHRPVLLIDEAQEMTAPVLSELRLIASTHFDSQSLLCVVLAGDERLQDKLRRDDLLPLGSRIRIRLATAAATPGELETTLDHLLAAAGNPALMTPALKHTLCEHALGNARVLANLASELLTAAAQSNRPQLDEQLYFDLFGKPAKPTTRPRSR